MAVYAHHQVSCAPRQWRAVANALSASAPHALDASGIKLYGIWRSQIGRPRDELNIITVSTSDVAEPCGDAEAQWLRSVDAIGHVETRAMQPTLRPVDHTPPVRQGNYAFRFFALPAENWSEFLELCAAAWPGFEAAYDSQVIGLWEIEGDQPDTRESLLLTRRPDLAMWERSKLPANAAEAEVRARLSRRYDLCDTTWVFTTTLLTATDSSDDARWA